MISARFSAIVLLLSGTAAIMHRRGDVDKVPLSEPLSTLPERIGTWQGTDVPLDAGVLAVLGKGVFLNRLYAAPSELPAASNVPAGQQPVGLFIGYFPTQRTGQSIHSPQNCLPGSGWVFESSGRTELKDAAGRASEVGEYVISDGTSKAEVLYWYRSHGRTIASDYVAKLYTLADSIRFNRTDAALVRVVTPLRPGETGLSAHNRAVGFAQQVAPLLPAYIPD